MAETTTVQADVIVTPVAEQDLITKVTQFKAQTQPVPENDIGFDYKEIEAIKDPVAKDIAIKAYKSMQAGVTKKFQEVAITRKEYEVKNAEIQAKLADMQTWTPEKVQNYLLNNPSFLQSAQMMSTQTQQNPGGLTDEQFSALTDKEKAELAQLPTLKSEIDQLKQVNYQAMVTQTDNQLKAKYGNYNSQEVDAAIARLAQMNPLEIREHVFKSIKHDENVKNSYELRQQEIQQLNQTRINAISVDGAQAINNDGLPTRLPNENDRAWFEKLANFRLTQSKRK